MPELTTKNRKTLSLLVLVVSFGMSAINVASAEELTFSFTKKLSLNPLPFTDAAQNAYWHGRGKYSNSHDVWKVTLTLNAADKHPNPETGIITLDKADFQAENMRSGAVHQVVLAGTVNVNNNTVTLAGTTSGGTDVMLNGIVRSWWKVKGAKKGPNVVQGTLSFN